MRKAPQGEHPKARTLSYARADEIPKWKSFHSFARLSGNVIIMELR